MKIIRLSVSQTINNIIQLMPGTHRAHGSVMSQSWCYFGLFFMWHFRSWAFCPPDFAHLLKIGHFLLVHVLLPRVERLCREIVSPLTVFIWKTKVSLVPVSSIRSVLIDPAGRLVLKKQNRS